MSRAESTPGSEPTPYDNVPDELQKRNQWLLWDSSADTPRRPHWKGDFQISWSDPDEWHTFEESDTSLQPITTTTPRANML